MGVVIQCLNTFFSFIYVLYVDVLYISTAEATFGFFKFEVGKKIKEGEKKIQSGFRDIDNCADLSLTSITLMVHAASECNNNTPNMA